MKVIDKLNSWMRRINESRCNFAKFNELLPYRLPQTTHNLILFGIIQIPLDTPKPIPPTHQEIRGHPNIHLIGINIQPIRLTTLHHLIRPPRHLNPQPTNPIRPPANMYFLNEIFKFAADYFECHDLVVEGDHIEEIALEEDAGGPAGTQCADIHEGEVGLVG